MFKANLLLSKFAERGLTQAEIADKLGINASSLNRKMNGETEFKRNEINLLKSILCLSANDVDAIFFAV